MKNYNAGPILISMAIATVLCLILLAACGGGTRRAPKVNFTPTPFPEKVGNCLIQANSDCAGADLTNIDLGSTTVGRDIIRKGAKLKGINLEEATVVNGRFVETILEGANFSGANLQGTDFTGAGLFQVDFTGADLTDVTFHQADTDEANFEGAVFCNTTMKDGTVRNEGCP